MKRQIFLLLLTIASASMSAQPKWLKKSTKALTTLHAIQTKGDTLSVPAFYIDAQGTAICALAPLQNAQRAWFKDADGTLRPLHRIQGFDATYNIARVSTEGSKRKTTPLPLSQTALNTSEVVYLMPKGSEDKVAQQEKAGSYAYFTLTQPADFTLAGYPLMNAEGAVAGIVQNPIRAKDAPNYALDIQLPLVLSIKAMDANATALSGSALLKALPADEDQARSFLYLVSAQPATQAQYAQDFIQRYPQQPTGHIILAGAQLQQGQTAEANATYANALKQGVNQRDEVLYARAQAIYSNVLRGDSTQADWTTERALEDVRQARSINDLPLYGLLEARLLFAAQRYQEASDGFLALTQTNMREANLFLYAAQCQERLGTPDSLILALNDSAVAQFQRPYPAQAADALWLRSMRLRALGRNRAAIRDMNDYEHLMQGQLTDQFYYQRFEAETQSRMFAQALSDIAKAIELRPDVAFYYAQQAAIQYRTSQPDLAITSCELGVQLDDKFPDIYRIWGICLRDKGQTTAAREKLQQAASLGDEMAKQLLNELSAQ